jgi:hypothetical protein
MESPENLKIEEIIKNKRNTYNIKRIESTNIELLYEENPSIASISTFPTSNYIESMLTVNPVSNNVLDYHMIDVDYEFEKKLGGNLCEAFIITGLANNKSKMINDSETFIAPCRHKECSIFPAYKPSVLHKFPKKDLDHLEINNNVI